MFAQIAILPFVNIAIMFGHVQLTLGIIHKRRCHFDKNEQKDFNLIAFFCFLTPLILNPFRDKFGENSQI